ncbi:YcaO-like family protein [Phreatobacter sp. AB_2022a]|uniref:YcaO-like family protein n=1 Tax=Phreatobacter sp. AB_2022a TaxID=3003134 RepID=UPI002286FD7F|nr:YcaO-like family protein [Phreatobacter sp. AB_2022a]MCZ0735969.1 YcaO-like family protein [Phreatobacter sp. AB_2022a]
MKWTSHPASAWQALSMDADGRFAGEATTADAAVLAARLNEASGPGPERPIPPAFLALAARAADIFEIEAPDAPGIHFVGAMTTPERHLDTPQATDMISAGACGATFREALVACLGETAERLAQSGSAAAATALPADRFGEGLDPAARAALAALAGPDAPADGVRAGLAARILAGGGTTLVPASLCLRGAGEAAVNPSIGCACGPTAAEATLSGLLEWVERDAAALWWHAGRPARLVALETLEEAGLLAMIGAVRQGRAARRTWMLDITSDLGVPCIACVSVTADGQGFAHGAAARLSPAAAARAAFVELCQMEVAWHLMALKRASGRAPSSPADLRHQARFDRIDAAALPMLAPRRPPALPAAAATPENLEGLVGRLAEAGYPALAVDLAHAAIGVPVVKTIVPGLQPLPSSVRTARLARAAASPGSAGQTDIPLY